jgi:hypothetical protein
MESVIGIITIGLFVKTGQKLLAINLTSLITLFIINIVFFAFA